MKTLSKLFILAFSMIVAIWAVMTFAKTKVKPPEALSAIDPYGVALNEQQEAAKRAFSRPFSDQYKDTELTNGLDKIARFYTEKKIDTKTANDNLREEVNTYVTNYQQRCRMVFAKEEWRTEDLIYIQNKNNFLRGITKYETNEMVLTESEQSALAQYDSIIGKYKKALALTYKTDFVSVDSTKTILAEAKEYAKDYWLSNCTSLVNKLENMKQAMNDSHYKYVSEMIELMFDSRKYTKTYYTGTLIDNVQNALNEYGTNAENLYGNKKDTDELLNKAKEYYVKAILCDCYKKEY